MLELELMDATMQMRPTPSQPRGLATRADIVGVARRLFSEHGYHRTGLADIQAATGLTKGAFYHHFRSKEELALAVLAAAAEDYQEHWIAPALAQATPGRRLEAMLDRALELNAQPEWSNCQMIATLCAEMTGRQERLHSEVHRFATERLDLWASLIREGQGSGEVRPGADPLVWAQWIHSTMLGLLLSRKLGAACAPPGRVIEQIKSALLCSKPAAQASGLRRQERPNRKGTLEHEND